jgi:hypothetical protein
MTLPSAAVCGLVHRIFWNSEALVGHKQLLSTDYYMLLAINRTKILSLMAHSHHSITLRQKNIQLSMMNMEHSIIGLPTEEIQKNSTYPEAGYTYIQLSGSA